MDYFQSQVIIRAKTKGVKLKPWVSDPTSSNLIKTDKSHDLSSYTGEKQDIDDKEYIKSSVGYLIDINNEKYVLGLNHGITNTYEIYMYAFNKSNNKLIKYNLNMVVNSVELDLVLLKPLNFNKKESNISLEYFMQDIPDKTNKLELCIIDIVDSKKRIITKNNYSCKLNKIDIDNKNSFTMPKVLYIDITVENNNFYKNDELGGISGSFLKCNNKILGMVSNIIMGTNIISILHSSNILRFLNEFKQTNNFYGLCGIGGILGFYEVELEDRKKQKVYIVKDSNNINYNDNSIKKVSKNRNNLKNNDIIYGLNGIEFDINGMLFDKKINSILPLQTYIALNYNFGMIIPLNIYRLNSKGNDHEKKIITINTRPISTMRYIPIKSDNIFYKFKGLVFVEITEELIETYSKNNINFVNPILDIVLSSSYRNNNEKLIMIISTDRSNLDVDYLTSYDEIGFPFKNKQKNYYNIYILDKINNKKVKNIHNINKYFNKIKNIIYLHIDNRRLKLEYTNDELNYKILS
jgi:hypothetical protein